MRILFAGTPDFAVPPLRALLGEHEVLAVFTQPDRRAGRGKKLLAPPVKQLALTEGIPVHQPTTLKDQAATLEAFKADAMVVVAYGMILPASILGIPRLGCLNIHASLLPRWRGAAPIQRAIQAGDSETGVSIMQMEAGLDTGPVYDTLRLPISEQDSSATLHDKLATLGAEGILATLARLQAEPTLIPIEQNHEDACYAHKLAKHEATLDWSQSATTLHNQIRAFNPWPGSETHHEQARIRIWESAIESNDLNNSETAAGTILSVEPHLTVQCGTGVLQLNRLQRDGGKQVSSKEFCNGYQLRAGDTLAPLDPHG